MMNAPSSWWPNYTKAKNIVYAFKGSSCGSKYVSMNNHGVLLVEVVMDNYEVNDLS